MVANGEFNKYGRNPEPKRKQKPRHNTQIAQAFVEALSGRNAGIL